MAQATKLIIDPKKWLGDNKILKMDWDVKAMHFHLMLLAWQNEPQGCIEAKDLGKYLSLDLSSEDWKNRISPQLIAVWQKKTLKNTLGQEVEFYVQSGLLKEIEKQNKPKVVRTKKTVTSKKAIVEDLSPEAMESIEKGFNLLDILDETEKISMIQPNNTLTEEQIKENSTTIWTLGIQLLADESFSAVKARGFLAKLAKEYGQEKLAMAIAQIHLKKTNPVDAKSYLVSMLKNGVIVKKPTIYQKTQHNQASGRLIL